MIKPKYKFDKLICSLTLPYPPSVNHYYQSRKYGGRCISKDGVNFRNMVKLEVLKQRAELLKHYKLPLDFIIGFKIFYAEKDGYRRDYDNPLKALNDSLITDPKKPDSRAELIKDDSLVKKATVDFLDKDPDKIGKCYLEVYSLITE